MATFRSVILSQLPQPVSSRLRAAKRALKSRHFIDETEVVALLAQRLRASDSVLVDVGAHHGAVTARFLGMGWSVVAYEPDPVNRREFQRRIGFNPRLQLSSAAVSDRPASSVSFFRSSVSTGISSLAAFHESHEASAEVQVVTLAEDLPARGVANVDFLKIDIEGFDYFALKGFDWTRVPRFALYEFEDRKTVPLGYSLSDSSAYVAGQGYHLVYSVWEPIVEYGTRHKWRGLFTTPPRDAPSCWGNVLCFREKADADECLRKFGSRSYRQLGRRTNG